MKGLIIYPDYKVENDSTKVYLYGRLENGQSFVTINDFEPYFFIKTSDSKKISKYLSKFEIKETNLTNFKGDSVSKISSKSQTELNKLFKAIHKSVETYEADIKPHYRFMMNNNLLGSIDISGDWNPSEKVDRVYENPEIKPSSFNPNIKIASIDIETSESGELYCIGLHSENLNKVFMITKHKIKNVISCVSELDCLEKFKSELLKLDPDIITGWNLIDFDLKFIQEAMRKNKIPLDIGRNNDSFRLRLESNFFRASSADITGRQVLDALLMIRDPFIQEAPSIKYADFENYTLENVSQAILGKGKLIKGRNRHEEITLLYKENTPESHQKLADYNLLDCQLVSEILEKTKLIDLCIERSKLTGMPFDRLTASIAAFDSLYIREANSRKIVSPTNAFTEKEEKIIGGFVKETSPGIYNNVVVLDFKSLYPSILKTFNIDPASYLGKTKEKGAIESPNGVYFKNQEGILPIIIHRLHEARELAKKEKRELSSYAIKIIMNSFWGVLASPNCRYFDFDLASSITNFARMIIQLTAKEIESKFKTSVIYSDTDSVFVLSMLEKEKANSLGKEIESYVNKFYQNYVRENYNRKSFLELQFEKQYISFMQPQLRSKDSEKGAKKRYAGLVEKNGKEYVEVVGLEAMRGDWVEAAREFQRELLLKVFKKEPVEKYIKEYVKKIKSGNLDQKLIYRKSIRKSLKDYTKTTPPHVKAARKLDSLDSNIIEYYITVDGPEPLQKLKHKIDYEHYVEKQIKPIAEQVLSLLNKKFEDSSEETKQSKLF